MDNRKTKEELNAVIEEVKDTPQEPEPEVEKIEVEEPTEEVPEAPVETPEVPATPETPVKKELTDYEREYKKASQEAMTQYFKNKKIAETFEEAESIPDPTESELKTYAFSLGQDYEILDDFSKNLLKRQLVSERRFEKVSEVVRESKNIDAWAGKVDTYINAPETIAAYPSISENDEEFRKFCMRPDRRGMNLEDLTTSFLYGLSTRVVPKAPKGSVITPASGSGEPNKSKPLNDEDAFRLRNNNPKEYMRLVKAGKIKIEI